MSSRVNPARLIPAALIALSGSTTALGAGPFGIAVNLGALNGATGFVCNGISPFDASGGSVASAGDINGDGYDDLIVGAAQADPNDQAYAGETYVVFGKATPFAPSLELSTLNGANGFILNGIDAYDRSGFSVASAGDVNGDGYDDLIIGATNADPNGQPGAGESYVVFGKASGFAPSLELSALDGASGFVLNGIATGDFSGRSVASAGDVNGDGYDDLIIGAYAAEPDGLIRASRVSYGAGESYVVFGKATPFAPSLDLSSLDGTTGFVINGFDPTVASGFSVASAGDVNGDGYDDVIIGAPFGGANELFPAGQSFVVFGKATPFAPSLDLSTLDGTNGFVCNSGDFTGNSGRSVASAGDVNGDGYDDVIIGDPPFGKSSIVFGKATPFAPSLDLTALDGTTGFVITGVFTGFSVASAGDVNGDGYDDVIVGASNASPNGQYAAGASYVVFGKAAGFTPSLDLSTLNGTNGFVLNGFTGYDLAGTSVASAGDVDGDGLDDLIVGAPGASPSGNFLAGVSYVVFGRSTPICPGDVTGDGFTNISDFNILAGNFGSAVAPNTDGDITGDGLVNISDFNILAGDFGCGP